MSYGPREPGVPYRPQAATVPQLAEGEHLALKWQWDGARSFAELIGMMRAQAQAFREADARGLGLSHPIETAQAQIVDPAGAQAAVDRVLGLLAATATVADASTVTLTWQAGSVEGDEWSPALRAQILAAELDGVDAPQLVDKLAGQLAEADLARMGELAGRWQMSVSAAGEIVEFDGA